jgi:HEAT repeat protein
VPFLIEILDRAPTTLRVAAARHLGELGARSAVASLVRAVRSPDLILRVACLKALGVIGDASTADVVAELAADDDNLAIQTTAAIALLRLADPRATEVLVMIALRNEPQARHSRRWAIRQLAESHADIASHDFDKIVAPLPFLDRLRLRRAIAVLGGTTFGKPGAG